MTDVYTYPPIGASKEAIAKWRESLPKYPYKPGDMIITPGAMDSLKEPVKPTYPITRGIWAAVEKAVQEYNQRKNLGPELFDAKQTWARMKKLMGI